MRRSARVLAVVGLLVTAAACSDGGNKAAPTTTTAPEVTTTTLPPPPAILTGLPIPDERNLRRPALTVKIDNAAQARPQSGIDKADVVFEEVVEGGVVRFMAVFQSRDAEVVGPVRSLRPVDSELVTPLKGLFAYSGGAPQFERLIKKAPVRLVGADQVGERYERRKGKRAPHNLYTSTATLYEKAKDDDEAPPALFTYGIPTGSAASQVSVVMGPMTTGLWDWDPELSLWLRSTNGTKHVVEEGPQLGFANVIVQYVRYSNTTSRDSAGFRVPTADVIGSGDALVLAGGTQVRAMWEKRTISDVTVYTDSTGVPVQLLPGPTWVMLAPVKAPTTLR